MIRRKGDDRLVKRGVYFVKSGTYKGCFLLYLDELSSNVSKTLVMYPDGDLVTMTKDQIKTNFEKEIFDFVKRIPRKVYAVCIGQHKGGQA